MREYRTIAPQDLLLGEKIGEGQFGDVHTGFLYPKVRGRRGREGGQGVGSKFPYLSGAQVVQDFYCRISIVTGNENRLFVIVVLKHVTSTWQYYWPLEDIKEQGATFKAFLSLCLNFDSEVLL
jgi:hypothetical protein